MLPAQLVLEPSASARTHFGGELGVVQQLLDLVGKIADVAGLRIERGVLR
jgi:hypothetical protein